MGSSSTKHINKYIGYLGKRLSVLEQFFFNTTYTQSCIILFLLLFMQKSVKQHKTLLKYTYPRTVKFPTDSTTYLI